jgi:hypothetical protein
MVDTELHPERTGNVQTKGTVGTKVDSLFSRLKDDIERHGEVHATFETVDKEVELRLGTTKINVQPSLIEVYDGDQWVAFRADKLVDWYVPMDVYHGGK